MSEMLIAAAGCLLSVVVCTLMMLAVLPLAKFVGGFEIEPEEDEQ